MTEPSTEPTERELLKAIRAAVNFLAFVALVQLVLLGLWIFGAIEIGLKSKATFP